LCVFFAVSDVNILLRFFVCRVTSARSTMLLELKTLLVNTFILP